MENIEKTMESTNGTVFLYCAIKDEKSISFFASAAEHTGRRLLRQEECQALDPAALASTSDKKRSFPSHCAKGCFTMGSIILVLLRLP